MSRCLYAIFTPVPAGPSAIPEGVAAYARRPVTVEHIDAQGESSPSQMPEKTETSLCDYSPSLMAPAGQLSMHARHSTQASVSTTATPSSFTLIASAGHPASQLPQPTQTLVSTTGFAIFLLLNSFGNKFTRHWQKRQKPSNYNPFVCGFQHYIISYSVRDTIAL